MRYHQDDQDGGDGHDEDLDETWICLTSSFRHGFMIPSTAFAGKGSEEKGEGERRKEKGYIRREKFEMVKVFRI